jgi:acyl carrier protein
MSRAEMRDRLLAFLETIRRPEVPLSAIGDGANLLEAGLIDSLAILQIIEFLEGEFGVDFTATGLDPFQLTSIPRILDFLEAHGR